MDAESAFCGRHWEASGDFRVPLNKDHSNMVKFSEHEREEYDKVLGSLHSFVEVATITIRGRFMVQEGE